MTQPQFPVVRRGYDRRVVDVALEDLRDQIAQAEATTAASRSYAAELLAELRRLQAIEDELTTSVELAQRMAEQVRAEARHEAGEIVAAARQEADELLTAARQEVDDRLNRADAEAGARLAVTELEANGRLADATAEAERLLAEVRAQLAVEAAEMERYRLAIAAEASMLEQIEQRLGPRLSRAAARLVEVVDAPDGIGPFSQATAALVEAARLLQRAVHGGLLESVAVVTEGGNASLQIVSRAIDLREGPIMVPIGRVPVATPPTPVATGDGTEDAGAEPGRTAGSDPEGHVDQDEKALNISSIALS